MSISKPICTDTKVPTNREAIQNQQYHFPYHYLPRLDGGELVSLHRQLNWGLDYLTYMTFLAERVADLKPATLLDVGCGDGRFYGIVADKVESYKGVDLSERAITWARCFNPGVDFEAADCGQIDGRFDVVALIETLEHVPDGEIEPFLSSIRQLVKPDGHFLMSVPSNNLPLNRKHYRHYDEDLLKSQLGGGFEILSTWWVYRLGTIEWLLRHLLINRFFTLNHRWSTAKIWGLHRKTSYLADSSNGAHIVCLARPKD